MKKSHFTSKVAFFFNNCLNLSFVSDKNTYTFVMQSTESDYNNGQMNKPTNISYGCSAARLFALLTALLIGGNVNFAQGFEIAFGGPKEDQGVAIVQTADHGFLEVGFSEGLLGDDNDIDIYVVRTDVDGTTLWERRYDEGFEEFPTEIVSNNGNFLISGHRQEVFNSPSKGYLLCINEFGAMLWSRTYGSADGGQKFNHILVTPDNGYLLTGTFTDGQTGRQDILLLKVDQTGEEIWRQVLGTNRDEEGIAAVLSPNGFVIGANGQSSALIDNNIFFYGVDGLGNFQWSRSYGDNNVGEQINDLIPTSDGNMAFVGSVNNASTALIAKANLNGDTLWYNEVIATPFDNLLNGVIEEEGGDVLVAAGEATPDAVSFNVDILMVKVNANDGSLIYQRLIGDDNVLNTAADLAPTVKGGYALAAFNALANVSFNDMTLYKTDSEGEHLTNHIRGRVFHSTDGCNPFSPGDRGLEGWLVRAESASSIFFSSTDSLGVYDLQVDVDNYTVSLLQKNNRWDICNPVALIVDFSETYDSTRHDFALIPAIDCPLLEVELSAGPAVSCEQQTITVNYGNQGSAAEQGVSVTIELDEILSFESSTIPLSDQDGQLLTFNLADLNAGEQGSFSIDVAVGCAGVQNQQAVSTEANILPVADCAPVSPDWDGSSIEVESFCTDTAIVFTIENKGANPTSNGLSYVVIEDIILVREAIVDLGPSEVEEVTFLFEDFPDGSTFRLIAQQSPGHPGNLFPTAVVEGCTEDGLNNFITGQVAQFADNDGDLNIDILTQEVFVLNTSEILALRAYPKGYQDSIITPNTSLEYTIFFSLDGMSDTIGRVVIRDTLSTLLDLNSLEMGAASHPYDFTLYQNGVLKITFDSIQLHAGGGTGGAGNTSQQQGYLSFRLSQKPNNAVGAVISNRAAVYFDYRAPMSSNSVRHVVGCQELFTSNCLLTSSVNYPSPKGVIINVYPNPFNTITTVNVEGWKDNDTKFEFRLYDLLGRQVLTKNFTGDQTQIERLNLPSATYYYELRGDGVPIGKGNLFVQ